MTFWQRNVDILHALPVRNLSHFRRIQAGIAMDSGIGQITVHTVNFRQVPAAAFRADMTEIGTFSVSSALMLEITISQIRAFSSPVNRVRHGMRFFRWHRLPSAHQNPLSCHLFL